uniref:Uncharacterized protein n=1 Tax=Panagrolaimus sp. ES5 TaxID=591445 RepID=A0AC34GGK1_9BILA
MSPKSVFFLSQDDKARVPLGLPAAQKQTRVAMHVQYRISLPDHDWVVAAKHKLIPSVYASCVASADGKMGVNGPTYCAVRSGKHDHSGADSHLYDFHRLFDLEEFSTYMKDEIGELKPIVLVTVDGGPDENPRYPKTLSAWISVFVQYKPDMIIVATHAPGQSAYNAVERRMAPLSKALTGVILPYDTYGSHLNPSHKTVDEALELKNFTAAGESLAEIWNEMSIANYPVIAQFISTDAKKPVLTEWSEQWINDHVLQTQYCLQISKCTNVSCCDKPRTSVFSIL